MGFNKTLRIGTRKSRLAITQARQVQKALLINHPEWCVELVPITTTGDRLSDVPAASIEGKGVFLKELEDALLNKEIDCAVHSMKDVPTELHPELAIVAMLRREDPHDALVAHCGISELSSGSSVGTDSSRRSSQILSCRPDLLVKPIRGNIDTRIKKWQNGQYDALVLAVAGLKRMGLEHLIAQALPFDIMLPAAGQGAIGIEGRSGDNDLIENISSLDDRETHVAVSAERTFLKAVGGGCRQPISVYGKVLGEQLHLHARIVHETSGAAVEGKASGSMEQSKTIAGRLAQQLLNSH